MAVPPELAHRRARVARLTQGDPERLEEARRDLAEANLEAHIRKVVDAAPPLTAAQRERLALLLHPAAPG